METKVEKISFKEMCDVFKKQNEVNDFEKEYGVIVFTKESFDKEYSVIERSYQVLSKCKFFNNKMLGNSLMGDCLDGKDYNVRLECYLDDWEIDYCYFVDKEIKIPVLQEENC